MQGGLLARPFARYRCAGDGLCCTDAHVLGHVARDEAERVRALEPKAIVRHPELKILAMATGPSGGCIFQDDDGCRIHPARGGDLQPKTCRRFPLGLVRTPHGGRVTTDHRCPCRTMGDRPPLDVARARDALCDRLGRLIADDHVTGRIRVNARAGVGFERYARFERALFDRLLQGPSDAELPGPFPGLEAMSWVDVAQQYRAHIDGTAGGEALAWFGDVLLWREEQTRSKRLRARPWAPSFDRAEARSPRPATADEVLHDWLCDELWALTWRHRGPLDKAFVDLSTRLEVARTIVARLEAVGARADRAAAEAVLVVEMAGLLPVWGLVVKAMKIARSPSHLEP